MPDVLAPKLTRSVRSAELLFDFAVERGADPAELLVDTGLTPSVLREPAAEIHADQELALVRNLVGILGDDAALGIDAGSRYHITSYGIWGFALVSSPTLGAAIDLGLRYMDLTFAFVRARLVVAGESADLVLDDTQIPPDVRRFLVERDAAAIVLFGRELFSASLPLRGAAFTLASPGPATTDCYRDAFGDNLDFDAGDNVLSLEPGWLKERLPQANAATAALLEEQCRDLLDARRVRSGIAEQVRSRLLSMLPCPPRLSQVAEDLHMSERTLRRRLEAEDTSFRNLVDEVREALASELLCADAIGIDEIAFRLGYSEPASFIHAFARWTGTTPTAFRRSGAKAANRVRPR